MDTKQLKIYAGVAAGVAVILTLFRGGNAQTGSNANTAAMAGWLQNNAVNAQATVGMYNVNAQSNAIAESQLTQRLQSVLTFMANGKNADNNGIAVKSMGYSSMLADHALSMTTQLAVEKQKSADYSKMIDLQAMQAQLTANTQRELAGVGADSQLNSQLLSTFGTLMNTWMQGNNSTTMGGGSEDSGLFGSGGMGGLAMNAMGGSGGSGWGSILGAMGGAAGIGGAIGAGSAVGGGMEGAAAVAMLA